MKLNEEIERLRGRWKVEIKQAQDEILDNKPQRYKKSLARALVEFDYLLVESKLAIFQLAGENKRLKEIIKGKHPESGWANAFELQGIITRLKIKQDALKEALEEQLLKRGFAYRGNCDGVPDDVRRGFIALGSPCDEIDKQALKKRGF